MFTQEVLLLEVSLLFLVESIAIKLLVYLVSHAYCAVGSQQEVIYTCSYNRGTEGMPEGRPWVMVWAPHSQTLISDSNEVNMSR